MLLRMRSSVALALLSVAQADASPPVGPPTAKYVVIYANHDRGDCDNVRGKANTAHYFNASQGLCFPVPPAPSSMTRPTLGELVGITANDQALKFAVTTSGVNVIVCTGGAQGPCTTCSTWHKEHAVPFGDCDASGRFTVDMVDWLPSPTPGRVLQRESYGPVPLAISPERYVMEDTSCDTHCRHGMLCRDVRLQCGASKVHRASSHEFLEYGTANGTCGGEPTSVAKANYSSSSVEPVTQQVFQTEWCGEECAIWKTLRAKYPLCDPPEMKTSHSVDLDTVLGGRCSKGHLSFGRWVEPTPPGECCHAALGAGHPAFPFGTPCTEVCHYYGRAGHDDEWCQVSTKQNYGACFCGPERWSGA